MNLIVIGVGMVLSGGMIAFVGAVNSSGKRALSNAQMMLGGMNIGLGIGMIITSL